MGCESVKSNFLGAVVHRTSTPRRTTGNINLVRYGTLLQLDASGLCKKLQRKGNLQSVPSRRCWRNGSQWMASLPPSLPPSLSLSLSLSFQQLMHVQLTWIGAFPSPFPEFGIKKIPHQATQFDEAKVPLHRNEPSESNRS